MAPASEAVPAAAAPLDLMAGFGAPAAADGGFDLLAGFGGAAPAPAPGMRRH